MLLRSLICWQESEEKKYFLRRVGHLGYKHGNFDVFKEINRFYEFLKPKIFGKQ